MRSPTVSRAAVALLAAFFLALLGCGEDDPLAEADPRCAAVCRIEEPPIEGALDICSEESSHDCLDQCAVRIEGVAPLCATCLLERARFRVPPSESPDVYCSTTTCWAVNADGQQCEYPLNDDAAMEACVRQLYPRREVACPVTWAPVGDCADVCD